MKTGTVNYSCEVVKETFHEFIRRPVRLKDFSGMDLEIGIRVCSEQNIYKRVTANVVNAAFLWNAQENFIYHSSIDVYQVFNFTIMFQNNVDDYKRIFESRF